MTKEKKKCHFQLSLGAFYNIVEKYYILRDLLVILPVTPVSSFLHPQYHSEIL